MDFVIECVKETFLLLSAAAVIVVFMRFAFGNTLTTKLFIWLIPGLLSMLMVIYIAARLGGIEKGLTLRTALFVPIGITALIANYYFVGKKLIGKLQQVAASLERSQEEIQTAAGEVASASQSLAEGAAEQASSLEETSSSLEEMTSMTKQSADNASQAKAMMAETRQIVEKVDHQMDEMAGAITEITRTSEETGKIIKTIDEISFQTNLLALNAAVEAARAGEAGAGFAVVADEVRNLALRAAEAARNTSGLIENTIKAVRHGNDLTSATREAFRENVSNAGKVAQLIDEIAAASGEQAQGIGQVNRAVSEMSRVTQQSAASAGESASASEVLTAQAQQMRGYMDDLSGVIGGGNSRTDGPQALISRESVRKERVHQPASSVRTVQPIKKLSAGPARSAPRLEQTIPSHEGRFKDF
jgi:methyl-accepting chemotaxis protein